MFPYVQIVDGVLIGVCLSLERYVLVCRRSIAILDEPNKPLDAVPQEEEDDEHFLLLTQVYVLVSYVRCRYLCTYAHEYPPYACYCAESLKGNVSVVYYSRHNHAP